MKTSIEPATRIAPQSLARIFQRLLKFGFLAWGGLFAQIAMIRQELVEEERLYAWCRLDVVGAQRRIKS